MAHTVLNSETTQYGYTIEFKETSKRFSVLIILIWWIIVFSCTEDCGVPAILLCHSVLTEMKYVSKKTLTANCAISSQETYGYALLS